MRIALLTFIFIVSVTATARARLGENADQLVARYGQPLSEADQKPVGDKLALSLVVFQKSGFEIDVTLSNGISVLESFKKINGEALSIGEVQTLLTNNSEGHGWEAPMFVDEEKVWTRDDSATAKLSREGTLLTVKSRELMREQATAKKLEEKPSLEGF